MPGCSNRISDVEIAHADGLVDRLRLEQSDQIAEVAAIAGAEIPAVVIRKILRLRLASVGRPGGSDRAGSLRGRLPDPARRPASKVGITKA